MAENKYKKHFLSRVIVRIDFASPIETINRKVPKQLSIKALKLFPIQDPPKTYVETVFKISTDEGAKKKEEITRKVWVFHGKDRDKRLELAPTHFLFDIRNYSTYEEMKEQFLSLVEILSDENEEMVIKRLGLRYINNIELKESEPTKWEKYINKNMLSCFKVHDKKNIILRAMNTLIFRYNGISMRFRYGMNNPDFPAKIKRKVFVLDLDAYYEGLVEIKNVQNNLDISHEIIQETFEKSITEELRKKMK